jgi:hypothetical protein
MVTSYSLGIIKQVAVENNKTRLLQIFNSVPHLSPMGFSRYLLLPVSSDLRQEKVEIKNVNAPEQSLELVIRLFVDDNSLGADQLIEDLTLAGGNTNSPVSKGDSKLNLLLFKVTCCETSVICFVGSCLSHSPWLCGSGAKASNISVQ